MQQSGFCIVDRLGPLLVLLQEIMYVLMLLQSLARSYCIAGRLRCATLVTYKSAIAVPGAS